MFSRCMTKCHYIHTYIGLCIFIDVEMGKVNAFCCTDSAGNSETNNDLPTVSLNHRI